MNTRCLHFATNASTLLLCPPICANFSNLINPLELSNLKSLPSSLSCSAILSLSEKDGCIWFSHFEFTPCTCQTEPVPDCVKKQLKTICSHNTCHSEREQNTCTQDNMHTHTYTYTHHKGSHAHTMPIIKSTRKRAHSHT